VTWRASQKDFIYAVIGEEFGLVGTTLILLCFVVIAWRGLRVATQAPDRFGAFRIPVRYGRARP
jgi:cell division protein FtsW (lipid II flippase)